MSLEHRSSPQVHNFFKMVTPLIRSLLIFVLWTVFPFASSDCPAADWPQFRGPGGQGHSEARNIPVTWDQDTNVEWKTRLPGVGWSSPVVVDGRIYLTTAVVEGDAEAYSDPGRKNQKMKTPIALRTLCLDAESGDVLWNVPISEVPPDTSIHTKNSHASSTPVVTGDRIYVHFGTFGTAALDPDGDVIWKKRIEYNPVHGSGSSPILFEDLLIFNCDGGDSPVVMALVAATGEECWKTARPDGPTKTFSFSTPLIIDVNGQLQLVSAGAGAVCSYDPRTGEELWRARYPDRFSVVPRPAFANGLVLVCTGYEGPCEMLAIRPNGTGDVTDSHIAWRADKFVPHNPSPIIHDGRVFLMSDNGIASCRDLQTGDLIWKERVGGDYSASPILGEGRIYFLSEDGLCTVIDAGPQFREFAKNALGEPTLASMAPLDGSLLIRTQDHLYRVGTR